MQLEEIADHKIYNELKKLIKPLRQHIEDYRTDPGGWNAAAQSKGFFLDRLKRFMDSFQGDEFKEAIQQSVNQVASQFNIKDAIVVFKNMKTGLEKMPYIHQQKNAVLFGEVSRKNLDLDQNKSLFPVFFIYASGNKQLEKSKFRQKVGQIISKNLSNLLREKLI